MLMTGEFIDTDKALDWGLINAAVQADELTSAVQELCTKIASKPAVAIHTGKQMFYRQIEQDLGGAYEFAGETMACNMMAEDTVEGIDAFIEKRAPKWSDQ